ncbi:hypothetical protein NPIL_557851 [Nephila pilipes]|uniref:Uncharacterized protein n=1 Tax=Nephila pilipes TaxID=299642 RepID=A0A8X6Q3E2_NEPPI|nr:hypothetical protein NPIL_557851 [Nephila pilipes]
MVHSEECLAAGGRVHTQRAEFVVHFLLMTDLDNIQAHLQRFGLAPDKICSLCRISNMDDYHHQNCPEIDNLSADITIRHWEVKRLMAKQPSMGISYMK